MTLIYILSQIFIVFYYIFLAATYQLKSKKSILLFNLAAVTSSGISYLLLSAYSGLAMAIVSVIRNVLFIVYNKADKKEKDNNNIFILIILYVISIIFAIFTYNGLLSLMSVFATMLYTYSVWQDNTKLYKVLGIPVSACMIIYNIYIFSVFGIALESIVFICAIIGTLREFKRS